MKVLPFIASTPAAALAQIHSQLGPDAMVLSMKELPTSGLSRLWQKHRGVEVLAGVPEMTDSAMNHSSRITTIPEKKAPLRLPRQPSESRPHVLIGPPGVGKTTLLCKWLSAAVLKENRKATLWRLDGAAANTSEILEIYGETLGVTVHRSWCEPAADIFDDCSCDRSAIADSGEPHGQLRLVDVPGIEMSDAEGWGALRAQLAMLPSPRLHLVLNGAYDTEILTRQVRAFAAFQPEDVSFTHLDEEERSERLIHFALGINCSLRFLSAGQKIPGGFWQQGPEATSAIGISF